MKTVSPDPSASYKEFETLFRGAMGKKMSTNNFIFGFIGIGMLMLFIGIFVGFIFAGLYLGLVIIAPVYDPAYQLIRKAFRLQDVPLCLVKPPLLKFLAAFLSLVIPAFLIFVGIRGLSTFGFCSQSVICVLIDLI